ncbi:hypothetical protein HUF18_08090 [Thalassolituus sp. ST750PaO-4]|uniref:hypothetical protein n=1 Tax=Thalassolituus sp. ST750PaO-4 TaxID=2742965 RepID=UPI001CE29DE7|nr:hypothetical protein [Thalassolituus sp. ST750PaO-4]MCA6059729.1 hypothetical protein [Thalassolituus sp. ST750PaO-4]
MQKAIAIALLIIISKATFANSGIEFRNRSNEVAECGKIHTQTGKWITFLVLESKEEKRFNKFTLNRKIRCNTKTEGGTTVFTYFIPNKSGTYEIIQDRVKATNKRNTRGWYPSTVIVFPDGEIYYNDQ